MFQPLASHRGAFDPAPAGGSSVIKMIQQGTITMASGSATGTYTISPTVTDTSKAIIIWNGFTSTSTSTAQDHKDAYILTLTNSSTVTATRGLTAAVTLSINFTIVEFASGVNSIQSGTIAIASGSGATNTATISAVGANAFVIYQGANWNAAIGTDTSVQASVTLTNSTTVTATVDANASVSQTVGYCVVDLDTTIVSSIQQKAVAFTGTNASDTDTITSVTTTSSALFFGGQTSQTAAATIGFNYSTFLTNGTTVTKTRSGANTTTRTVNYTVVSFNPTALNGNIQRSSTLALSAQTSNTATITSVDTTKSFVNWSGFSAAAAAPNVIFPTLKLTNATTITAAINASGSVTVPFEVISFA